MKLDLINVTVSDERAKRILEYFLSEATYVLSDDAIITLVQDDFEGEEFLLEINEKITVRYSDYLSLRNALATLSTLARVRDNALFFEACTLSQKPDCSYRSVMLDLARGIRDFSELKNHVILIAKAKLNHLHLHLFDSEGICFRAESFPEKSYLENAYTVEQMKELNSLAKLLALEIVPEIDMPAHSSKIIESLPDFLCKVDSPSAWTVCAGSEKVYEFYDSVIKEVTSIFEGKYFHIGGDELEFADRPERNLLCKWSECSACNALMEREGLKDRQELFYYFVNRIYSIVKKYGRQMIMWSDQIDCARPCPIPKDVIMHFWRIAMKDRGPYENCSMNGQLKMGYTLINSHYPETYFDFDHYMSSSSLSKFDWRANPENDFPEKIMGSEICAWEYGNKEYEHYNTSLPFTVFLFGDKLWSGKDLEYTDEYRRFMTRCVLGASTPEGLDLSLIYCDIMPPRLFYNSSFDYTKVTTPVEVLEEMKATLKTVNSVHAPYYIKAIDEVLTHISE